MIYTHQMYTIGLCQKMDALCAGLSDEQQEIARDVLGRVAGKWPLWVLYVLAGHGGPLRFSRLKEQVEGISQKMLTQTLRQLERDGLVSRRLYPQVPPRVEYDLTPLGKDLLGQMLPLWEWVAGQAGRFSAARQAFDGNAQDRLPAA